MNFPYHSSFKRIITCMLVLALATISCTWSLIDLNISSGQATEIPNQKPVSGPTATPVALAEINFSVSILHPLESGQTLAIGILDEVTGLGLNPTLYAMNVVDANHFSIKLPLPMNAVIKYRYYRQGSIPAIEDTSFGQQVRYRIYDVTGSGSVDDQIATWSDKNFSGAIGKIDGVVTDGVTAQPVPNILITAGGVSTLSDSFGQFILEGLPVGTHLLTAYAMDGTYSTFQQGASVSAGLVTTAVIKLTPAPTVQVSFVVSLPKETSPDASVRLAGNLLQLGNSFSDLSGGISTIATRMPILTPIGDGRLGVSLRLPVGADIEYKYTLGDGFWNAEHGSDYSFLIRRLIVPTNDLTVQDTVATWQSGKDSAPISFNVNVPGNTPAGETIFIQFNPYGWTEPLPMWPKGNNQWSYKLYGPLNVLGSFQYRYCRNGQCGSADDAQTAGSAVNGRPVSTSLVEENIQESVNAWQWWPESEPSTLTATSVVVRPAAFWAGLELSPNFSPSWQAFMPGTMQNAKGLNANFVVLTPTWTASMASPLIFGPQPGSDSLWADSLQTAQIGRAQNLNIAIYAIPHLLPSTADFWLKAPRSPQWWNAWFERYRAFAVYHADLAAQSGSQALILGGDSVLPSLPGGKLIDGSSSNPPADAEARWRKIMVEVHQHFSGLVLWAHPYNGNPISPAPPFMDQFYGFYLLWSAPLSVNSDATVETMTNTAVNLLDQDIAPFLLAAKKGVVIAIDYPSAQGAATGCVPSGGGGCLDWAALSRPYPDIPSVNLDLQGQSDLYQAMLRAINQRDWVGGFISRGFYPPLALMDKSSSTRGKSAADLLWYWFPRMLGSTK